MPRIFVFRDSLEWWTLAQHSPISQPKDFTKYALFATRCIKALHILVLGFLVLASGLCTRVSFHFLVWGLNPVDNSNKLSTFHGALLRSVTNTTSPYGNTIISIHFVWAVFLVITFPCVYNIASSIITLCKKRDTSEKFFLKGFIWVSSETFVHLEHIWPEIGTNQITESTERRVYIVPLSLINSISWTFLTCRNFRVRCVAISDKPKRKHEYMCFHLQC